MGYLTHIHVQYHGGTNFGRTSSSFVTTRYYDEAPLDEYGMGPIRIMPSLEIHYFSL